MHISVIPYSVIPISDETVGKSFVHWNGDWTACRTSPAAADPRAVTDEHVERVITLTLESTPKDATHWSIRSMARAYPVRAT